MSERKYSDGQRFGAWTVVVAYPGDGSARAVCRCDCGSVRSMPRADLRSDRKMQCRKCWIKEQATVADGQQYGSWTVITAYPGRPNRTSALCRCACGTVKYVQRGALRYGMSSRCMRCRLDWRTRLIGRKVGTTRKVIAVDHDQVVVQCSKCSTKAVLSIATVRAGIRNPRCGYCETLASARAVVATGISRQAIHARVRSGWTREEAISTPKGQLPPRIVALRAQAAS